MPRPGCGMAGNQVGAGRHLLAGGFIIGSFLVFSFGSRRSLFIDRFLDLHCALVLAGVCGERSAKRVECSWAFVVRRELVLKVISRAQAQGRQPSGSRPQGTTRLRPEKG